MTTLAIDIGGTKLAAALIDKNLRIRQRRELPTPASKTPDVLREALKALVEPLRAEARQVAIASTGIIQEGMLLALNPHNLGGLLHFPLVQTLETIAGLPVLAVNDAQAAAWAEYHALPDDIRDMVFITVSTGVGGGVVCDGKLLTGKGGLAGHLGHTLADPHGPVCGCGRVGCVEAIASGRGMAAAARDDLAGCDAKNPIYSRWRRPSAGAASGKPIRAGNRADGRRCESDHRLPMCDHWRQRRVSWGIPGAGSRVFDARACALSRGAERRSLSA
ncbi:kinase [Salmonella enterica subsp. salamae]|nr:kinase [Salmonella enterica subsp. salamae]